MSTVDREGRVAVLAPVWLVPATLADFECRHGLLDHCEQCASDDAHAEPHGAATSIGAADAC
jgi:hypothetical protein